MRCQPFDSVSTGKNTEVIDSNLLKIIKFTRKTLTVTADSFRGENRTIPEICTDKTIGRITDFEFPVAYGDKISILSCYGR